MPSETVSHPVITMTRPGGICSHGRWGENCVRCALRLHNEGGLGGTRGRPSTPSPTRASPVSLDKVSSREHRDEEAWTRARGGRPRKYESHAARAVAYRQRKARTARQAIEALERRLGEAP
jgi:hypothetical protein